MHQKAQTARRRAERTIEELRERLAQVEGERDVTVAQVAEMTNVLAEKAWEDESEDEVITSLLLPSISPQIIHLERGGERGDREDGG